MAEKVNVSKGVKDFSKQGLSGVLVGSAIVGAYQGFNLGDKITVMASKVPVVGRFASQAGVGLAQMVLGIGMIMIRKKKAKTIERGVYIATATNGTIDVVRGLVSRFKK